MTQIPAPFPSPAPAARPASGDGPDLMFVIRHYRWLIIIGTLLGLLVGTGLYFTLRALIPKYKAESVFSVRGAMNSPFAKEGEKDRPEEISMFIRGEVELFKSNEFFEEVFKLDEIKNTSWYKSKKSPQLQSARKALSDALGVEPIQNTALFRVTLTIAEREEVADILNAICQAYSNWLKDRTARQTSVDLAAYHNQRDTAQKNLDSATIAANDYRQLHDIQGMISTQTILLTALGQLDARLTEYVLDKKNLEKAVDSLQKEQKDPAYVLPLELQRMVDNDPTVRNLEDLKMSLERERDVQAKLNGWESVLVRTIRERITAVDLQLKPVRLKAETNAKQGQMNNTVGALAAVDARIVDLKTEHDKKQAAARTLDDNLVGYRSLDDSVRVARDSFNQAQTELSEKEGIFATLQPRVENRKKAQTPTPDDIASPMMIAYLPSGTAIGLALAFGIAYLIELTNTRVRTPRDITRTLQLPLLGFVPDQEDDDLLNGDMATSVRTSPSSMTAESFRQIRGRLSAQADGSPLRTILVSSVAPGGGSTTVASNLATGLALNGRRVLLVDANFYRPGVSAIFPDAPSIGFSDLLSDATKADAASAATPDLPNLFVMGVGSKQSIGSAELLDTGACRDAISRLKDKFDVIVFDGAPLSLVSDSISLGSKVDGVIAVVRAGRETRGTVARVREQLRQVRANLLGVILNAAQTQSSGYFKENYRSFYQYANGSANGHAVAGRQATQAL
jgi:polysaccharide biosynthesis transport protein